MEDRIRAIHAALRREHGEATPPRDMPAVDYLINTILSQNTSDGNRDAAWESLVDEYGRDYRAMEEAGHDELADAIRTAGLANQKTTRIQDALRTVREHAGGYEMDFVDEMDVDEALEWLTDIRGIGKKTAGIVLLFRFDKPYFPVDTHIERVSKRFGLISEDCSYSRAHDRLTEAVPHEIMYSFHVLTITHGREYCSAREANCDNPVCDRFCDCEYC
jgi:endonuclease-3